MEEIEYEICPLYTACIKVYSLADKKGNVFYVGYTSKSLEYRLSQHVNGSRPYQIEIEKPGHLKISAKAEHIRKLNFKVVATVIDIAWVASQHGYVIPSIGRRLEKKWIQKYLDLGYALTNREIKTYNKALTKEADFIGKTITI